MKKPLKEFIRKMSENDLKKNDPKLLPKILKT